MSLPPASAHSILGSTAGSISHIRFNLATEGNEPLRCDVRYAITTLSPLPVVIFAHGFKGFKEWGSIPYICTRLAAVGFYVLSFNFSHNGVEGDSEEFTRLDRFRENTISREVDETIALVDAVSRQAVPDAERIIPSEISLLGHSRGGGIVLLAASRSSKVRRVVTWAAVATFHRYTDAQRRRWREQGYLEVVNGRTGETMQLGEALLDDIESHAEELNVLRAAHDLGRRLLVLHGEQDLSVRIDDAEAIVAAADPALTTFVRLPQTNHTFGAVHPFDGSNPVLDRAIDISTDFLHANTAGLTGSNRNDL